MARKQESETTITDNIDTTTNTTKSSKKRKHDHVESPSLTSKKKHKEHKHKKDKTHKKHKKDREHKKDKKKDKKDKKKKSKASEKDDTADNKVQSSTATKDTSPSNPGITSATESSTKQKNPETKLFNNRIQYSLTRDYVDEKVDKTPLYKSRIITHLPKVHHDFFISDSDSDSDDDIGVSSGVEPALEWHKRYLSGPLVREKRLEWPTVENGKWNLQERIRLEKRVKKVAKNAGMDLEAFRQDVLFDRPNDRLNIWWEIARPFPKRDLHAIVEKVRMTYPANKYGGRWTKQEDEKLKGLMKEYGENYASMVSYFHNRDRKAIQNRCYYLDTKDQTAANIAKKGSWTEDEVKKLYDAIKKYQRDHVGPIKWSVISAELGGTRTPVQLRSKWNITRTMLESSEGKVWSQPLTIKDKLDLFERMQAKNWKKEEDIKFNELSTAKMTSLQAREIYLRNRASLTGFLTLPYPEIISKLVETRRCMVKSMEE
ncbi:hypothetical protein K492DRAFT_207173 [Lichtheimia hyalospora FSU 10163]|nr:hypothetical protein K492DRAFT_207173 [Lichtheimia hyalospora FSU 10163]